MTRTDRASLLLHVSKEQVFAAFTDRDALAAWLPPKGMHGRFDSFDMRQGGSFRMVLTYDDPSRSTGKTSQDFDATDVQITELVTGERIVQEVVFESHDPAFSGTMRMEWTLSAVDEGTEVTIQATGVPDGINGRDHAEGLTSSLANLAAHLEP